jgi:hypothetical protein
MVVGMGRLPDEEDSVRTRPSLLNAMRRTEAELGAQEVPKRRRRVRDRLPGWTRKPGPAALATILLLLVGCGLYGTVELLADGNAAVSTTPTEVVQPTQIVPPPQTDDPVGVGDPAEGAGVGATGAASAPPTDRAGQPIPTRSPGRSAAAGLFCAATVTIASRWPGGYQAEVTVANTGAQPVSGWTVTWAFANGEVITQVWNGLDTASGAQHSVRNADYNGILGPGTSTTFGFTTNVTGDDVPAPSAACAAQP